MLSMEVKIYMQNCYQWTDIDRWSPVGFTVLRVVPKLGSALGLTIYCNWI